MSPLLRSEPLFLVEVIKKCPMCCWRLKDENDADYVIRGKMVHIFMDEENFESDEDDLVE